MQCDGMGYAGKGGDGADIRLFTKSECDKLGGNWSGNGECLKKEGLTIKTIRILRVT